MVADVVDSQRWCRAEKVWWESIGEIFLTFVNSENVGRLNACGSTVAVQLTAGGLALFYISRRVAGPTGGGSANKKIAQRTKSFLSLILYSTPYFLVYGSHWFFFVLLRIEHSDGLHVIDLRARDQLVVDFFLVVILLCCPPTRCSGCRAPICYANTVSWHCVIFDHVDKSNSSSPSLFISDDISIKCRVICCQFPHAPPLSSTN